MESMIVILQLGIWVIVVIMIALIALYFYLMKVLPNKIDKTAFTEEFMKGVEKHKQMGYDDYSFNTEDDGINSNYNTVDDGLNSYYNDEDDGPIQHL